MSRRMSLTNDDVRKLSAKICYFVTHTEEYVDADVVLLYSQFRNEPDLTILKQISITDRKTVAYPISDSKNINLHFHTVNDSTDMREGAYGIMEPCTNAPEVCLSEKSLCVVPAIAIDKEGYRLGYGKGYYDKFLNSYKGKYLCTVYDDFICDFLPRFDTDIRIKTIVTDTGVVRIK